MTQTSAPALALDVRYPMHVKPGDLVAGVVSVDAPTRPCQPFASAMRVESVEVITPDAARPRAKVYRFHYTGGIAGSTYAMLDQIMVIAGA